MKKDNLCIDCKKIIWNTSVRCHQCNLILRNKQAKGVMNCTSCGNEIVRITYVQKYCSICSDKIANIRQHMRDKKRYHDNKSAFKIKWKSWYEKHKEEYIQKRKIDNKLWVKLTGYGYSKRKEYISKYRKLQRKNPRKVTEFRLRSLFYQALKNYSKTGKILKSEKYGINYEKIITHLKPFPEHIERYHIDHIMPLSHFDLNNADEIKKAFAPENHQWLLAEENIRKGNKIGKY